MGVWPGGCVAAGLTGFRIFLAAGRVLCPPSERRPDPVAAWEGHFVMAWQGLGSVPGRGGRSGLASTHSAGPPGVAGAMTMCSGTGLLSQMIERGRLAGSCRVSELARGLVTLPVCGCAVVAGGLASVVSGACAAASRW